MKLIVVDGEIRIIRLIALNLVIVDAAANHSLLEVWVKSIYEALARIRGITLVYEIARDLVCGTF